MGRNFSDYLISKLIDRDRGIHDIRTSFLNLGGKRKDKTLQERIITNVYSLVGRSLLMQVIEEQQLGMSGLLDENKVVTWEKCWVCRQLS